MEPFKLPLVCAGINDLVTSSKTCEDDSLYNFVQRRFGKEVAEYAVGKEPIKENQFPQACS